MSSFSSISRKIRVSTKAHLCDAPRAAQVVFCRVTMLGLLRISSNAKAMHGQPFSNAEAWAIYQTFQGMTDCELRQEPPRLETAFASLTLDASLPHRLWTDALSGRLCHRRQHPPGVI